MKPVDFELRQFVFKCTYHNLELEADGDKSPMKMVFKDVGRRVPEAGGSTIWEATNHWEIDLSDMFCPFWNDNEAAQFNSEQRADEESEACSNSFQCFELEKADK